MNYIFDYASIPYKSKIIIYGINEVSQQYIYQITQSHFAEIVAVINPTASKIISNDFDVINPFQIGKYQYDYVIVASSEKECKSITCFLQNVGVDKNKIVTIFDNVKILYNQLYTFTALEQNKVNIAIKLGIGMGDCIITKKLIEAIMQFGNCYIDLYIADVTFDFCKMLYSDMNIHSYYNCQNYAFDVVKYNYDLALIPVYSVNIVFISDKLKNKHYELYVVMSRIRRVYELMYIDVENELINYIIFTRCRVYGLNAYTNFSCSGLLDITDNKVNIPMDTNKELDYLNLNLPKYYLTINYGGTTKKILPKIWCFEYYQQLVTSLTQLYPHIALVQLGVNNTPKLQDVDYHLFDVDIEVVKYVVKNSMLHIDSEGGLVHLTTQLGTKCVVMFGPTPVWFFGYDSNINIVSQVCNSCYYLDRDFTRCIKDNPICMRAIKPEDVIKKICNFFKKTLDNGC